ncbi:hypothetical protein ACNA6I_22865 [Rossellomorea sp. FS2]|uniref:hypothetical protein n=1 Tax=Rossellomorea sp. FS2 TaxID=3391447 RepID=UPI003A4E2EF1
MKFEIEKKYLVLKVEEKANVNLYTLIDNETGDKVVSIGVKEKSIKNFDFSKVLITIRTQTEKFETKNGVKYVEVLNTFVSKIEKVQS